jgi:DNA transformation protein
MKRLPEFITHLLDLLAPIAGVSARGMFGGWGFFHGGKMFALVADDVFYVKCDAVTLTEFESRGLEPFTYATSEGPRTIPTYRKVPADALDSSPALCEWAHRGLDASSRTPAPKPRRGKSA